MLKVDALGLKQVADLFIVDCSVIDEVFAGWCTINDSWYGKLWAFDLSVGIWVIFLIYNVCEKYTNRGCLTVSVLSWLVNQFGKLVQTHLLSALSKNEKQRFDTVWFARAVRAYDRCEVLMERSNHFSAMIRFEVF